MHLTCISLYMCFVYMFLKFNVNWFSYEYIDICKWKARMCGLTFIEIFYFYTSSVSQWNRTNAMLWLESELCAWSPSSMSWHAYTTHLNTRKLPRYLPVKYCSPLSLYHPFLCYTILFCLWYIEHVSPYIIIKLIILLQFVGCYF